MVNVLNVAEKPSVARSVAAILSHNQMRMREGRSVYNKIFEFDYSINGQHCHMLFTSVSGHLMELAFDDRFRKWHSCDPADLYSAPVRKTVPEDKQNIKRTLEEEARKCQWLLLWLDCDREGENIAFEVIEVCTAINNRLDIRRARFSALIEREIHHAVQNLVAPNKWFSDAVDARQEIDLRIGASFTRFQTMLLKDKFVIDIAQDDRNLVLSYGPCQFPTLGFIVERYWEVQSHEPEEFWSIKCSHKSDEGIANFTWSRGRLFDYTAAVVIYEMCVEEATATVTKVQQQQRYNYPPYPLSTLELEKRASQYFRMSSELTMKVAEELYQAGLISYPRTETDCFSDKTDLHAIVREQQENPVWGRYAQRLLDPEEGLWSNPRNGGHDDKAHPPIHPTKPLPSESRWNQNHQNIYELVVRHFLACVSKPAVAAETAVDIDIAGETFSSSGRMILERNYLDIYRFHSWGGHLIPSYMERQQFIPTSLTLVSGVTSPPPLLSESDLLSCMDKAGIGTDATMHDHIKKLLDRLYATKNSNLQFSPTKLGEALVLGYDAMGHELWKPNLRSMMESDMKQVSIGHKSKEDVLSSSLQQMKACFLDAKLKKEKLFESMEIFFARTNTTSGIEQRDVGDVVRPCGQCGVANMLLKKNREGKLMVGCSGYPQCKNVAWLPGPVLEASVTSTICQSCSPGPVYLIQFKFRQCEIPPGFDVNHLGCIGGCDHILKQLTEICGTGTRARANNRTLPSTINQSGTRQSSSTLHQPGTRQSGSTLHQPGTRQSGSAVRQPGTQHTSVPQQNTISDNGHSSIQCSTCGEPCSVKTANTANNRGRRFYTCASADCNFFVWEEAMSSNGPPSEGRAGGRGRGRRGRGRANRRSDVSATTFVSASGGPVSTRCFSCGDPSHFANNCPNRNL